MKEFKTCSDIMLPTSIIINLYQIMTKLCIVDDSNSMNDGTALSNVVIHPAASNPA